MAFKVTVFVAIAALSHKEGWANYITIRSRTILQVVTGVLLFGLACIEADFAERFLLRVPTASLRTTILPLLAAIGTHSEGKRSHDMVRLGRVSLNEFANLIALDWWGITYHNMRKKVFNFFNSFFLIAISEL